MRNVFTITLFLSTLSLAACGGDSSTPDETEPPVNECAGNLDCTAVCPADAVDVQCGVGRFCICSLQPDPGCQVAADCEADCSGSASCSDDGICHCEVEVPLACTDVSDCTVNCDGLKSCSTEGICECATTEVLVCTDVSDCTVNCDGVKSCSTEGVCECEVTVEFVCTSYSDCFAGCDGAPTCNAGICQCDLGCVADANCDADCLGADSFSCSVGKCVCTHTELLGCIADTDCALTCGADMTATCDTGVCYCTPQSATLMVNVEDDAGSLVLGAFTVTNTLDGSITWSSVGSAVLVNIPLGDYDIVFGHVTGLVTPAPITVTLSTDGETVTASGVYLPSKLEVSPVTNPDILAVKGSQNVETLTLRFEATEDILLNAFTVRFYADSGSIAPADIVYGAGTVPANTIIASATLMRGVDVLSGPVGLQADLSHGASSSGFDPGSEDHYFATFASLGYWFNSGIPSYLTVKVDLLNTVTEDVHIYAEVLMCSINAEDTSGNAVVAGGYTQSCPVLSMQLVTVITNGVLEAFAENLPDGGIVIAGSSGNAVSSYRFHASMEAFQITKLTLINDLAGAFNSAVSTGAVSQVTIRYVNLYGVDQTRTASLTGGSVTFAGLDMYVPIDGDATLDIEVDATTMAGFGEALSGQTFRLGLQDLGNTISTFEAVGQTTSSTDNFTDGNEVSNQSDVNSFVVRKTKPTFALATGLSTVLVNGNNRLYGFTVTADSAGSVSFGRLSFEVLGDNGIATVSFSNFSFYRGATLMTANVNYVGQTLIVSFDVEESIAAGASQTYYLDADVSGAVANSQVDVAFKADATSDLGMAAPCLNVNTGKIFDNNGSSLFTSADAFSTGNIVERRTSWSDKSADTHAYPTVTNGVVTAGTGSCDWTNGFGLDLDLVQAHTLTF